MNNRFAFSKWRKGKAHDTLTMIIFLFVIADNDNV